MTDELTALAELRKPFPPEQIGLLPKPTKRDNPKGKCNQCNGWHGLPALHVDFVGHADLTARLLDVDPFWNWEPVAFDENGEPKVTIRGNTARMWIRLTVKSMTRLGVGTCAANKEELEKELISDALRNAGMRFGAALDLWSKSEKVKTEDDDAPADQSKQQHPQATKPQQAKSSPKKADSETGEILSGIQSLIDKLDDAGQQRLRNKMREANYPPIDNLPKAAEKKVREWIEEIDKQASLEEPF